MNNFAKLALDSGGMIKPLIIPSEFTQGTGLCNPSIYNKDDQLIVNIRHVGYNLYHAEKDQKFPSWHGPLIYLHPEDDLTLKTENYICFLDDNLEILKFIKTDMTLNVAPKWEFIGLEDARLAFWDNKLYLTGVRRDTTTNGEGRIELSEIDIIDNNIKEINRHRIQTPSGNSYCEKNWMPIIDREYQYVKWTNPTEVVKADISNNSSIQLSLSQTKEPLPRDIRGGSQVIPFDDYYIAVTHEVDLWKGEAGHKDAQYYHRFIIWDKNFNIVKYSKEFKFMDARIEFACGICQYKNDYLITFGVQDNAAYILRVTKQTIKDFIYDN